MQKPEELKNILKEIIPKMKSSKLKNEKKVCKYCKLPWVSTSNIFTKNYPGGMKEIMVAQCDCELIRGEKKEEGIRLKLTIRAIKKAGLGKRFLAKNFNNFEQNPNQKAYDVCVGYARNIVDNTESGKGLLLHGPVGTGKTHLIAGIIDYIARMRKRTFSGNIIFTTMINLLAELRFSVQEQGKTESTIREYQKCNLLILDDFGTEKETDWTAETIYKIINYRYEEVKPIIITTNSNVAEFLRFFDERLASRIMETCTILKLTGKDYRLYGKEN